MPVSTFDHFRRDPVDYNALKHAVDAYERRPVRRAEDHVVAADREVAVVIARLHAELTRRERSLRALAGIGRDVARLLQDFFRRGYATHHLDLSELEEHARQWLVGALGLFDRVLETVTRKDVTIDE